MKKRKPTIRSSWVSLEFPGGTDENWLHNSFCFIPTISALSLDITDPFHSGFNLENPSTILQNNTPINGYIGSRFASDQNGVTRTNQNHISLDQFTAPYLRSLILKTDDMIGSNGELSSTYNFGKANTTTQSIFPLFPQTPNIIDKDLEVLDGGKLWVNRFGKIGNIANSGNPDNQMNIEFEVTIAKNTCTGEGVIVSIEDGGELILGDAYNPNKNKGKLTIHDDGILIVRSGGETILNDESRITIDEEGLLEIKEGGLLNTIFGSGISVKAGGKLIVRDGGILRLSHYSSLTIEPGGLLIFEDGAILQLWDAPAVDGEARIIVKGALEIQGEIQYDGNGFFDFYPGHELKLTNGTLTLDGDGKASRLIRLTEGTDLNFGSAVVELSNCRIVYDAQSTILAEEGGLKFINVDFQGHQYKTNGIEPFNIFRLDMEGCTFRDHAVGINVDGATGAAISAGFILEDCEFFDNLIGIAAFNVPLTIIKNSDFNDGIGEENTGLFLYDCGKLDIRGTGIIGFDYGIKTFRTPRLHLFNSTISHCEYGIFDGDGTGIQPSAVYLIDDSEISSCGQGIYMIGNEFEGLVFMDCARLWENDIGVNGDDITLAIDARSHALATDGTIRPNSFKRNTGGKYFNICYLDKWEDIGNNFTATYNYWDEEPSTNSSSGQYHIRKPATSSSTNCDSGPITVQMTYTPEQHTQPEGCIPRMPVIHDPERTLPSGFTDKNCSQIVYLDTTTIVGTYSAGISSFYEGEFNDASAYLEQVAASTLDTTSVVCADYIRTARAMAPPSVLQRPAPDQNHEVWAEEIRNEQWLIRPVPFNDKLIISSNVLEGTAQVLDMTGRDIYTFELDSNDKTFEILTQNWNPGIYFIKITTPAGETYSQKVLKN